jgi:hypothetical protein
MAGTQTTDKKYQHFVLVLSGICAIVVGVTMILSWWDAVVMLVKGGLGVVCTVAGLVVLYVARSRA